MTEKLHVALCRDRHDGSQQQKLLRQLYEGLAPRSDVAVSRLPHLYDLPPDGKAIRYLRSIEGNLVVVCWLYPRAAFWMLDANEVCGRMGDSPLMRDDAVDDSAPADDSLGSRRSIWCFDLRQFDDAEPLLAEIDRILGECVERVAVPAAVAGGNGHVDLEEATHRRWYPVVDKDRCGNCLECLNFCLFGVFGVDSQGRLFVEDPDACKDGCPACSRVCPRGAIMFPDHQNPGIAGDATVPFAELNVDLVQLFETASRKDLAAAERARILAEQDPGIQQPASQETPRDDLDDLVDGLDDAAL